MRNGSGLCLLYASLTLTFLFARAFYLNEQDLERIRNRDQAELAYNFEFSFGNDTGNDASKTSKDQQFPPAFQVKFSSFNKTNVINFVRIRHNSNEYPIGQANVYVLDSDSQKPTLHLDGKDNLGFELYRQDNGRGIATLIRNEPKNPKQHRFKLIGTIFNNDTETSHTLSYEILPMSMSSYQRMFKRADQHETRDDANMYAIIRRPAEQGKAGAQILLDIQKRVKLAYESFRAEKNVSKRSMHSFKYPMFRPGLRASGPISLYIELLLVLDSSIYVDHQRYAQTSDMSTTLYNMRIYFVHYINSVNQRYLNSFLSDSNLRIYLKLTNILVLTSPVSWSNSSIYGDSSYPTYNGKQVLLAQPTLDAFTNYMSSQSSLPTYDYAIGLVDKDIWSSSSGTVSQRSQILGFSYYGQICSTNRYSVVEEIGGFANVNAIAQESAKMIGSYYDGDNTPLSVVCLPASNYIMTPVLGVYSSNLQNQYYFSPCSIAQFKSYLLTNSYTSVASLASCLTNAPTVQAIASISTYGNLGGQYWTANDQCQMRFGPTASFCSQYNSTMCQSLACRTSSNATSCFIKNGFGAGDGTFCAPGKMCLEGQCVASTKVPSTSCIFGDDVIVNNTLIPDALPLPQMSCTEVFLLLGIRAYTYCSNSTFRQTCCSSCQIYDLIGCSDSNSACPSFSAYCEDLITTINGKPVRQACPYTCGLCSKTTLSCSDNLCQNGATCLSIGVTPNALITFACSCPTGYEGLFCESKIQCEPDPCQNGGTCYPIGSLGYFCQCTDSYTGINCTDSASSSTTTSSTLSTTVSVVTVTGTTTSSGALCSTGICQNGGLCYQTSSTTFYCSCAYGFSGILCQYTDSCLSSPCKNGATCISLLTSSQYFCLCPDKYTGVSCETDLTNQCLYNNGNCMNGATCTVSSSTYEVYCVCPALFTGVRCDQYLNPCFTTNGYPVCANYGACQINITSAPYYKCYCLTGYYGTNCNSTSPTAGNLKSKAISPVEASRTLTLKLIAILLALLYING